MKASLAAQRVRQIIRRTGNDPKGLVWINSNDYITELHVDLQYLPHDDVEKIEQGMRHIPDGNFTWEVEISSAYYHSRSY